MANVSEMMKNAKAVTDAWNRGSANADKGKTLGGLLMIIKAENKLCCAARERIESEIADINNTFAPGLAAEKRAKRLNEYNDFVAEHKRKVTEQLNEICEAKTAEVDRFISSTGDRDLRELINDLRLRSEVSDREWQAITVRVTESHDFQCMKLLAEVAEKLNRYYKPPYDPEEIISEIEKAKDDLSHMISVLDKPSEDWTLSEMMIMGDYDDHRTYNQERLDRLDNGIGVAVPEKYKSLIDRLKDARDVAFNNGDNPTANAISRFLYEKSQYIEDRQIVSEHFKGEAESLIKKAYSTATVKGANFNNLVHYFTPNKSNV